MGKAAVSPMAWLVSMKVIDTMVLF